MHVKAMSSFQFAKVDYKSAVKTKERKQAKFTVEFQPAWPHCEVWGALYKKPSVVQIVENMFL